MNPLVLHDVQCPYCGETIALQVDDSAGDQAYIEDCSVCCRPIEVRLRVSSDGPLIDVGRDDD